MVELDSVIIGVYRHPLILAVHTDEPSKPVRASEML
jgi:hypothetical protein